MESTEITEPSAKGSRRQPWLRGLGPIGWWFLLVLVFFAIRTHQRLSEETRLLFSVKLAGHDLMYGATASVDGRGVESGGRIPIGWHSFLVTHPKAEPFTTNLFIWYGRHDLGEINLKRAQGTLEIHADPPAAVISIRGPEFSLELTNSAGLTTSVPTDTYTVEANYRHLRESREITVFTNAPGNYWIRPRFGAAQLTCNQSNASFQVLKTDGELLEAGEFPLTIQEVPEGNYSVKAWHNRNQQTRALAVKAGITNTAEIQFLYGSAILQTEPSGAMVTASDGRDLGFTPLRLGELPVGRWQFSFRRDGYEPASVSLEVLAEQTNAFITNLLSLNYARSLNAARDYLRSQNYGEAETAAVTALQAKPNDPDALAVQNEANGKSLLQIANVFGKQGDYTSGIRELSLVLKALPDNEEAKDLLAEFKKREPEQIERQRVKRLELPKKTFDNLTSGMIDTALFESHELKTGKRAVETPSAIVTQLTSMQPPFKIVRSDMVGEIFTIEATQEFPGGQRRCVIVGGQSKDDETQIFFKVLELRKAAFYDQPLDALVGAGTAKFTVINPSQPQLSDKLRLQVEEGTRFVTERIDAALGHSPVEKR